MPRMIASGISGGDRMHRAGLAFVLAAGVAAAQEKEPPAATPDHSAHILTPPPPATPRINGARVFGVRPGHPFRFTIPATGKRPMTFSAPDLPAGLAVDARTGIITGVLNEPGQHH